MDEYEQQYEDVHNTYDDGFVWTVAGFHSEYESGLILLIGFVVTAF